MNKKDSLRNIMKTYLILTSSAGHLAKRIQAKNKELKIVFPDLNKEEKRLFPDGEVYLRLPFTLLLPKKGGGGNHKKRVVVLHSGAPRPNEGLIELELILGILKNNKVKPELFFSYFPYGMQDRAFGKGEINVAENLIKKLIKYYQVKKIYIIDSHFYGKKWLRKYPIINISALPLLIQKAKEDFGKKILFFSPDIGGQRRTKILGIKKERIDSYQVKMVFPKINLKGKIVGAVDDIIKTGGTLLKFYQISKKLGAKKVIALATHGVIPAGILRVKKKYSKLYLTNTIEQKGVNLDITDLILETALSH